MKYVFLLELLAKGFLGRATQAKAILPKNGFPHLFLCCRVAVCPTHRYVGLLVPPNSERVNFSLEVFVVGIPPVVLLLYIICIDLTFSIALLETCSNI